MLLAFGLRNLLALLLAHALLLLAFLARLAFGVALGTECLTMRRMREYTTLYEVFSATDMMRAGVGGGGCVEIHENLS